MVLRFISSGLLHLAEQAHRHQQIKLPYPASLQRGLDKLTILCWQKGAAPPSSVPGLLQWCRRPLASWPLDLSIETVGPSDTLLFDGQPTQVCQEWAVDAMDVEAEVLERQLLQEVLEVCRSANKPEAYVAFRRLLIEHPVLTALEWHTQTSAPVLSRVADQLRNAYAPAPPECIVDGQIHCCYACGNLLVRAVAGKLVCSDDRCARTKPTRTDRTFAERDGILWLTRELRTFIAAPGRAELRLADVLNKRGAAVELWPAFDAYDLAIRFADGEVWGVDVKDWANPFLLARRVQPIPRTPSWNQAFFVFPESRLKRPDYLRAFRNTCKILGGSPPTFALMERQFLARVERKMKSGRANAR